LPKNKRQHEERLKKEGFANYAIRPDGEREFYAPVAYIALFDVRNQKALGYDVFSEQTRREAIGKAIRSGEATITAKVKLVQENDKSHRGIAQGTRSFSQSAGKRC
jgi:CHASE1-domain containing sensor protein